MVCADGSTVSLAITRTGPEWKKRLQARRDAGGLSGGFACFLVAERRLFLACLPGDVRGGGGTGLLAGGRTFRVTAERGPTVWSATAVSGKSARGFFGEEPGIAAGSGRRSSVVQRTCVGRCAGFSCPVPARGCPLPACAPVALLPQMILKLRPYRR